MKKWQATNDQSSSRTFAFELFAVAVLLPFLLLKAFAAFLALIAACVVRTPTDEFVRRGRVGRLTMLCVAIAHTAAADRYVSNAVEIL